MYVYSNSSTGVEAAHDELSVHNGVISDNNELNLFKSILSITIISDRMGKKIMIYGKDATDNSNGTLT